MLSFIQLFPKSCKERNYISLGGVIDVALTTFLSARPDINVIYVLIQMKLEEIRFLMSMKLAKNKELSMLSDDNNAVG